MPSLITVFLNAATIMYRHYCPVQIASVNRGRVRHALDLVPGAARPSTLDNAMAREFVLAMIVVLGSINADQVGVVDRLPRPGETVLGASFRIEAGGKGANQALAACRAGGDVSLFAAVGRDHLATVALEHLRTEGIDLGGVEVREVSTGVAIIVVDAAGENQIAVLSGANGTVGADLARRALGHCSTEGVLLLQQEVPVEANKVALASAKTRGVRTILNIAPYSSETPSIAGSASILVANETEFGLLLGDEPEQIDAAVVNMAAQNGQSIIVTMGERGALVGTGDALFRIPAWPISAVDTVGAGDTFCGYLAHGISTGHPIEIAARRAVIAASLACTSRGAQPAIPDAKEVDRLLDGRH